MDPIIFSLESIYSVFSEMVLWIVLSFCREHSCWCNPKFKQLWCDLLEQTFSIVGFKFEFEWPPIIQKILMFHDTTLKRCIFASLIEWTLQPWVHLARLVSKNTKTIINSNGSHYFQLRIDLRSILRDVIAHLSKFCREHSCWCNSNAQQLWCDLVEQEFSIIGFKLLVILKNS